TGLGTRVEMDPDLVIPDGRLSLATGALHPLLTAQTRGEGWATALVERLARDFSVEIDAQWNKLPQKQRDLVLYGSGAGAHGSRGMLEGRFEGVLDLLMRRYQESTSDAVRGRLERYLRERRCRGCGG